MTYTVGSLFAGIGGIDLAFAWADYQTAWQVEIDDYCTQILQRHWPDVPRYRDVRGVTGRGGKGWRRYERLAPVDVMVGGFPCQDISVAGRGAGIKAGTRSGLWFEFARLIGELRPRVVLLENASAILARDGTVVIGSLAEMGYDARWGTIRAADAGAPHQRERWFCVAYDNDTRQLQPPWGVGEQRRRIGNGGESVADAEHRRRKGRQPNGPRADPVMLPGGTGTRLTTQSRLGRDPHGLPGGLDFPGWPAGPGQPQHEWEPPRVVSGQPYRAARLRALGNAVVPQVVYPLAVAIREWLEAQDADGNG